MKQSHRETQRELAAERERRERDAQSIARVLDDYSAALTMLVVVCDAVDAAGLRLELRPDVAAALPAARAQAADVQKSLIDIRDGILRRRA